jgi:hypothetical protein
MGLEGEPHRTFLQLDVGNRWAGLEIGTNHVKDPTLDHRVAKVQQMDHAVEPEATEVLSPDQAAGPKLALDHDRPVPQH